MRHTAQRFLDENPVRRAVFNKEELDRINSHLTTALISGTQRPFDHRTSYGTSAASQRVLRSLTPSLGEFPIAKTGNPLNRDPCGEAHRLHPPLGGPTNSAMVGTLYGYLLLISKSANSATNTLGDTLNA